MVEIECSWVKPAWINRRIVQQGLDGAQGEAENIFMRRALEIVLVIAVLLGLFGQTVAIATGPTTTAIEATAPATMPMDCVGMMQRDGDSSVPCDRMTLACIAGMGCAMPFTLDVGRPLVTEAMIDVCSRAWPSTPSMEGRSVAPEPHPPSTQA